MQSLVDFRELTRFCASLAQCDVYRHAKALALNWMACPDREVTIFRPAQARRREGNELYKEAQVGSGTASKFFFFQGSEVLVQVSCGRAIGRKGGEKWADVEDKLVTFVLSSFLCLDCPS